MTAPDGAMAAAPGALRGAHAVVTGGGRGIGAAIASELARLGARLTIMGRDETALGAHADRLRQAGWTVEPIRCDVTDEASVESAFAAAAERQGAASILVNNAGVGSSVATHEMTLEEWNRTIAVNLTGAFLGCRAVLPGMLAARQGRIVNIGSTASLRGYYAMAAYCASKHGLLGLTRSLALEVVRKGITVNAVCPGYTETDMAQGAIDNLMAHGRSEQDAREMILRTLPRRVLTKPEEVAVAVGWLCAPEASGITGIALPVAGGEVT